MYFIQGRRRGIAYLKKTIPFFQLSQQLFAQRIHLINAHLSKYYTISDFTAHIRLWILLITSILLICPLIWYQELSTNVFWALVCSGFGITMIGVPLTFRKHSVEFRVLHRSHRIHSHPKITILV
ncbi:hypothetical protein BDR26DRAFT_238785 [Obelidium mucronatum]|nr:hypothetical protein BDR26DRAFT_238785 [Obelidium mucronatum]